MDVYRRLARQQVSALDGWRAIGEDGGVGPVHVAPCLWTGPYSRAAEPEPR
jgi:hypothetical protein